MHIESICGTNANIINATHKFEYTASMKNIETRSQYAIKTFIKWLHMTE